MAATSLIPAGFTFVNPKLFLSVKAREGVSDLLKKSDDRNPEVQDMYIYNDFYGYAVLDLIDATLTKLNGKVLKKDWNEAMLLAEILTHFMNIEHSYFGVDDGERVDVTNKAYGALLVNVLRAVKKEGHLDATHFPSLETFLKSAADLGDSMSHQSYESAYECVCKAIGRRLFEGKTTEQKQLEKVRVEEWLKTVDKEEQGNDDDEDDEDDDDDKEWFSGAKLKDEELKDPDFALSRVWKEYKEYLKFVPTLPLRGPPEWDITSWTDAQKRPFLFSTMDATMDY